MADDESRNEDAQERPGKPSKKDDPKKSSKSGDKKDSKKTESKKEDGKVEKKATKTSASDKKSESKPKVKRGFFLFRFIREIVEQLRKVVYPTRKELLTYTLVVIVFVAFIIAAISGFDYAFNRAVKLVFGAA